MRRAVFTIAALVVSSGGLTENLEVSRHVDLRDTEALALLQKSNPQHYAQIREIVAGLREMPQRAESGWLEASFKARDVDLENLRFLTSNPAKQLLRFTLDDTRYTMHLVRRDLNPKFAPAEVEPAPVKPPK